MNISPFEEKRLRMFASLLQDQVGRALGAREGEHLWERHVLDSLAPASHLPAGARVADVGSGAGLPGIPLALVRPDTAITLVEPRRERVRWLRQTLDLLEVANAEVHPGRWAALTLRRFDVAVARALAQPRVALRMLRTGPPVGRIFLYVAGGATLPGAVVVSEVLDSGRRIVSIEENP